MTVYERDLLVLIASAIRNEQNNWTRMAIDYLLQRIDGIGNSKEHLNNLNLEVE